MGEYATYNGQSVKIGTCEDMYYLRHEARASVVPQRGSVDPVADVLSLRFRFPWPDEDGIEPGSDGGRGFERAVAVPGFVLEGDAAAFDHANVQFSAHAGYLVSLPCPEGPEYTTPATVEGYRGHSVHTTGAQVHRNGFAGAVQLVAQKQLADGRVVPIIRCGGCGAMARVEDLASIERMAIACRSEADRRARDAGDGAAHFWHRIADRLLAGAGLSAEGR